MSKPLALIVEDDSRLATIFAEALRSAHFETEIIEDGQIAMDRLAEISPAVVILDLHLPHVPGKDILFRITNDPRLSHTGVIVATADAMMADELREAADLVLIKPISFTQLRELASRLYAS